MGKAISRNDPCPCGSGKKYKVCCLGKAPPEAKRKKFFLPAILSVVGIAAGIALGLKHGLGAGVAAAGVAFVVAALLLILRDPPPPNSGGGHPASIDFGK